MEDENGLELSLGLSCGRSSGKSKIVDISSVPKLEAGGTSSRQVVKNKRVNNMLVPFFSIM
ncbi:callose synthase 7-like [Iris pallida]|uniref:Callose synthase 7-like n=1 Tax=Iris pallida TaxID=29817 RepID=A0AAX6FCB0_IRIPA|nr:callose synthase 7-like [Iris pallida]